MDPPFPDRQIQGNRERGRGRVAEPFNDRVQLRRGDAEPFAQRAQDPAIGLMENHLPEIVNADAEFLQNPCHRFG